MATTDTVPTEGSGVVDSSGDGYRARPNVIRTRAAAKGLKWSARALAVHCHINRHTAQKLLNAQPVSQQTMARVMRYLAKPGEPTEALFKVIPHPDGQGD